MTVKALLFLALIGFILYYLISWVRLTRKHGVPGKATPSAPNLGIGFVPTYG